MAILVDSTVWIDYFNGIDNWRTDRLDGLLGSGLLVTGDLILAEVLQGFREERDFERARAALLLLPVLAMGGVELAVESAENFRRLRRKGITVRATIDCLIATFCLRQGLALLHNDRDFDSFAGHLGLEVVGDVGES